MPLDRIITVNIEAEGHRDDQGDYIPGPVTSHRMWARVTDGGSSDALAEGGIVVVKRAVWDVRYRRDILETIPNRLSVVDEYGTRYHVETVTDYQARRRAIRITGAEVVV